MEKIKVLNLYAGIGGNRKLWENVEVTAVENNKEIANIYQDFFLGDKVIIADAHKYLLEHYMEFDFIWSSPPCQTHSRMNKASRHINFRYPDMKLYEEIILLGHFFKGIWVVENVKPYYEPLIKTREVDRHFFWANFNISKIKIPRPRFKGRKGWGSSWLHATKKEVMDWLGIHFKKNIYIDGNHCEVQVLRNCVHPKLGLHVFNCAFKEKQMVLEV
ncbi:hypothetical protein LCGC14_0884730 [marine sediment metagenome]|uniref:DNA (cytosine-5-)-methyltransferase n=1 Tax=marine sediment metagenome TaxID=412755 RepID=A0A0F9RKE8_9ZZZZ